MQYAAEILWFERKRYFAGVLAVAFSAVLIAVQGGVLVGLVSTVSAPVDLSEAEIWIAARRTPSVDNGGPIDNRWRNRLLMHGGIAHTDEFVEEYSRWWNPNSGMVLVLICGLNLNDDQCLGPITKLSPELKIALSEPGAVAVNRDDMKKLGVKKVGDVAQIHGQLVRVVGFLDDMGSMTGCYLFCSIPTARRLLHYQDDQTTYVLARVGSNTTVREVVNDLKTIPDFDVLTKNEFSSKSRWYWILETKSGLAVGFTAILGLLVGAVVTSQTLYSATATMIRELAVLKALGVPAWRMNLLVVQQAAMIGLAGLLIGIPIAFGFQSLGNLIGTRIVLDNILVIGTSVIVLFMAITSGLFALRSLSNVDPAELLR